GGQGAFRAAGGELVRGDPADGPGRGQLEVTGGNVGKPGVRRLALEGGVDAGRLQLLRDQGVDLGVVGESGRVRDRDRDLLAALGEEAVRSLGVTGLLQDLRRGGRAARAGDGHAGDRAAPGVVQL